MPKSSATKGINKATCYSTKDVDLWPMSAISKMKVSAVVETLSQLFPQYLKSELCQYVLEIFKEEKSNFCNINNCTIVSRAAEAILTSDLQRGTKVKDQVKPAAAPSTCKECLICCSQMEIPLSIRLQCGHIFHDVCVKRWFEEQSTCPTCRRYCLLDEDFPPLF